MRTKTVLSVAAALAAGAFTLQAQVYSVNVVGYVNQEMPAQTLIAVANPLDNGTNDLDSVLGGVPNKSTAQFWNGGGFDVASKTSTGWSPNTSIPPGVGFFVNSFSTYTNTYVGQLAANSGDSVTNSLPAALVMVGSPLPYAGDLNTPELGLGTIPNKSTAQFWNGGGYDVSSKTSTGWSPATPIAVGQGFFLNSFSANDWIQVAP